MLTIKDDEQVSTVTDHRDVLAGIPDDVATDLAEQIRQHGYGELIDVFTPAQLAEARAQAEAVIAAAGGDYASLAGSTELHGAILHDLGQSDALADICRSLSSQVCSDVSSDVQLSQTFRCLSGRSGSGHNNYFHFDSYVLTIIIPVAIPTTGLTGDLILWPDVRTIRRSYLTNVADKFIAEQGMIQHLIKWLVPRSRSVVRLPLVLGNIYIFCGYRTLHANEPVDADALRATMVLHCIDPHENAASKRFFGWLRTVAKGRSKSA